MPPEFGTRHDRSEPWSETDVMTQLLSSPSPRRHPTLDDAEPLALPAGLVDLLSPNPAEEPADARPGEPLRFTPQSAKRAAGDDEDEEEVEDEDDKPDADAEEEEDDDLDDDEDEDDEDDDDEEEEEDEFEDDEDDFDDDDDEDDFDEDE